MMGRRPVAVLDYSKCHPENCDKGICLAALACPNKVLKQEAPYEMPEPNPTMCVGCGECALACSLKAIRMVK